MGKLNWCRGLAEVFAVWFVSVAVAASAAPVGFDVNDVSFLFPLKNGRPFPALGLASDQLMPFSIFERVLLFENPNGTLAKLPYMDRKFITNPDFWYVTSIRYDNCGEVFDLREDIDPVNGEKIHLAKRAAGCQPRLRLVVQPHNFFGNPLATAMHLLFRLDASDEQSLITALTELKALARTALAVDTSGQPLMLHPALMADAGGGTDKFGSVLKEKVLAVLYGGSGLDAKLEIVTLTMHVDIDHWRLVGGYVQPGIAGLIWRRFATEFSKQFNDASDRAILTGVEDFDCDRHSICLFKPTVQPTLAPDSSALTYIFQDILEMKALQVPGQRTEDVYLAAELIDNPLKTHFFNTNCVSCHQSSNLRDRTKLHSDQGLPAGVSRFVPNAYLSEFTNNVINFGYLGTSPKISTRTAADSAMVAAAINLRQGASAVGIEPKSLSDYWACLTTEKDWTTCLFK